MTRVLVRRSGIAAALVIVVAGGVGGGLWAARLAGVDHEGEMKGIAANDALPPAATASPQVLHPVVVNLPSGPPRVATGGVDGLGRDVTISCGSCHANLDLTVPRRSATDPPMTFHQGMTFSHGSLSCTSCHNQENFNTLRLADGTAVAYPDVMTMCGQCHAPQARDWEHGAHGGMLGHWDLTRGGRFRKSCIDCHDPHAPQFPSMTPTFKPIDRFLPRGRHDGTHERPGRE